MEVIFADGHWIVRENHVITSVIDPSPHWAGSAAMEWFKLYIDMREGDVWFQVEPDWERIVAWQRQQIQQQSEGQE